MLDLRRCTLRLSSAQFSECLLSVERGMGKIGIHTAVIVKPEDTDRLRESVDLASQNGRFLGVFTGADSDRKALELLADVHRVAPPPAPNMATWRNNSVQLLANVLARAMR